MTRDFPDCTLTCNQETPLLDFPGEVISLEHTHTQRAHSNIFRRYTELRVSVSSQRKPDKNSFQVGRQEEQRQSFELMCTHCPSLFFQSAQGIKERKFSTSGFSLGKERVAACVQLSGLRNAPGTDFHVFCVSSDRHCAQWMPQTRPEELISPAGACPGNRQAKIRLSSFS